MCSSCGGAAWGRTAGRSRDGSVAVHCDDPWFCSSARAWVPKGVTALGFLAKPGVGLPREPSPATHSADPVDGEDASVGPLLLPGKPPTVPPRSTLLPKRSIFDILYIDILSSPHPPIKGPGPTPSQPGPGVDARVEAQVVAEPIGGRPAAVMFFFLRFWRVWGWGATGD